MKFQKKILIQTILLISFSSCLAAGENWVYFHENLPQELQRLAIPLKFEKSNSTFFETSQKTIDSSELDPGQEPNEYQYLIDFGTLIDGNKYRMMLKKADINFLNPSSSYHLMKAKITCLKDGKSETIKEGILYLGRDMQLPLQLSSQQIAVPGEEPLNGIFEVYISSSKIPYQARYKTEFKGSVSGSVSTKKAFINAALTCKNSTSLKDRWINLSLKPFDDQIPPVACNGKISDTMKLGKAKVIVEKIAEDSSELVLAVLEGSLESDALPIPKTPELKLEIGQPLPDFARVDLIKRQLLTLNDIKKEAGKDGYIALIFGEFKKDMPDFYGGRPPYMDLSLDEKMMTDMLTRETKKKVVICFVCQQLSISDLYQKWLGNDPVFHVLSDFSNPLNVRFQIVTMMRGPMYFPPPNTKEETLRDKLKLAKEKIVTALVDGHGNLLYFNADAGPVLSESLSEMNNLIKEKKHKINLLKKK